jgi:hypothetical protein
VPKVILNGSRIVAIARELVSRTMPQDMRMNLKGQSRLLTRAFHQPIEPISRERRSLLINEDEWRLSSFPLKLAQCANFVAPNEVRGWLQLRWPEGSATNFRCN